VAVAAVPVRHLLVGAVGEAVVAGAEGPVLEKEVEDLAVERTRIRSISGYRWVTIPLPSLWEAKHSHSQHESSKRLAGRSMDRSLR